MHPPGYDSMHGGALNVQHGMEKQQLRLSPLCIVNRCHILCPPAGQRVGKTALAAAAFTFPTEQKMKERSTRSPAPSLGTQPQLD